MYKILVIGCGNIGALYDWESNQILSHTKAFAQYKNVTITVFDINEDLANKVAKKYKANVCNTISVEKLKNFDCVSICTPTSTHFAYLQMTFEAEVKLVICEKPVSYQINELTDLLLKYKESKTKVLVNYIRRFQPAFFELKKKVAEICENEVCTNISVRYQRGFLNNCSHALDTLQFLFGREISFEKIIKTNVVYDQFDTDPTMSLLAKWNSINVNICGLANVEFSHFEIDLYFVLHKISIKDAGNSIQIIRAPKKTNGVLNSLSIFEQFDFKNCLENYMQPVVLKALEILENKNQADNFCEAVELNKIILNFIKN